MSELIKDFTTWMNEGFCGSNTGGYIFQRTKRLMLADGIGLSVQAGSGNYCSPRVDSECGSYAEYSQSEIGFPSAPIDEIKEFAGCDEDYTNTVYPYVPREVITDLIAAHGGVIGFDVPKQVKK